MSHAIPVTIYSPVLVLKTCAFVYQETELLVSTVWSTELTNVIRAILVTTHKPELVLKTCAFVYQETELLVSNV